MQFVIMTIPYETVLKTESQLFHNTFLVEQSPCHYPTGCFLFGMLPARIGTKLTVKRLVQMYLTTMIVSNLIAICWWKISTKIYLMRSICRFKYDSALYQGYSFMILHPLRSIWIIFMLVSPKQMWITQGSITHSSPWWEDGMNRSPQIVKSVSSKLAYVRRGELLCAHILRLVSILLDTISSVARSLSASRGWPYRSTASIMGHLSPAVSSDGIHNFAELFPYRSCAYWTLSLPMGSFRPPFGVDQTWNSSSYKPLTIANHIRIWLFNRTPTSS